MRQRFKWAISVLVLAAVYFGLGKFGLSLAFVNRSASPVWPPTGVALAALLLYGRGIWPGVFLGAFFVNITTQGSFWTALGIASGNTLEAVVAAEIVQRFIHGVKAFEKAQDILRYVFFAAVPSTIISATFGVTTLCLTGFGNWTNYADIWLTWWLGDTTSNLLVTPLVLIWATKGFPELNFRHTAEAAGLLISVLLVGRVVFQGTNPFDYLAVIPLLWAGFRFGERAAITAAIIMSAMAIWGTRHGLGPFAKPDLNQSLLLLQTFMGITSVMALVLASLVSERKRAEQALLSVKEQLARTNEELERRVQMRTAEWKTTNSQLEDFIYSMAHDLRAPLRSMQSFSSMLLREYTAELDATAQDYARRIARSAETMDKMVLDLLAYGQVARTTAMADVSVETAWASALAQNEQIIHEKKARVEVTSPLPTVRANAATLNQVLANLLNNALKFVEPGVTPTIRFWADQGPDRVRLWLEDNGIGIAPEHNERVFRIFEQLNGKKYSGTGIGLSIVSKGVERMGGRVSLESAPGRGSRFWIELTKA